MKKTPYVWILPLLLLTPHAGHAQSDDPLASLQRDLQKQMPLTKLTANHSDVVTAGTILVLKKDGLRVYPSHLPAAPINTYKGGKLSESFGDGMKVDMIDGLTQPGGSASIPRKTLVAGEKFWLADSRVQKDKIELAIITEPYDDGRYWGVIKLPLAKGETPSAEEMFKRIAEVVDVQPSDSAGAAQPAAPADVPAPPPAPAMAAIPPPPPPADTPPPAPATRTIALGQSKDTVTANFGQPQRVVKLATKEIYTYPDMKVTFVNGKVSDVQ